MKTTEYLAFPTCLIEGQPLTCLARVSSPGPRAVRRQPWWPYEFPSTQQSVTTCLMTGFGEEEGRGADLQHLPTFMVRKLPRWPISGHLCAVTEYRVGKRCTASALLSWCEPAASLTSSCIGKLLSNNDDQTSIKHFPLFHSRYDSKPFTSINVFNLIMIFEAGKILVPVLRIRKLTIQETKRST